MSELPDAPRRLNPRVVEGLRWGTGLLSTSLFGVLSVMLGLLWQSLLYGLGPLSYYRTHTELVSVPATVTKVEQTDLPSGRAMAAIALVKVNDTVLQAKGFGPKAEVAVQGEAVTVLVPTRAPRQAYLLEFQQTPIAVTTLLKVAAGFFLPCLLLFALALIRSKRILRLLTTGSLDDARSRRMVQLPRPFNDKKLGQWESGGKTFWAITPAETNDLTFLKTAEQSGFVESYLSDWDVRDGELSSDSLQTRLQVLLNKGQVLGLVLLGLAFLFT